MKNSNDGVSEITKQWLEQKNTKQQLKKKNRKRTGKRVEGKKKRSNHTKKQKQLKDLRRKSISLILKGRRSMGQFKQLTTQPSRFKGEASSPAARMAQMRSNKRYKPGD